MGEKRVVVIKGTRIPSSSTGTLRGCAWEYRRSIRRQRVLMLSLRLESPPLLYPFHPLSLSLSLLFVQPPGCTTLSFSRALLWLSSITLVPSLHSCQLDFLHSSLSLFLSLSVSGSSGPFKFIVPPLLHSHRRLNCLPTKNKAYSTAERAFVYMHTATPFASSVSRCGIKHSDCLCLLRSPFSFLDLYPRSLFWFHCGRGLTKFIFVNGRT